MNKKLLLIENEQARSPFAEAYRTLRTNIQFSKTDGKLRSILFTSSISGEGKSVSVANTAIAMAKTGKKVLVLDCDFRKPSQHTIFGRTALGITNVLFGEYPKDKVIQKTDIENLSLLASGSIPPNPSELLGSEKMQELLKALSADFDYLLIDAPPVLPVTDACVIASKVDGVILVLGAGIVSPDSAKVARERLERVNACLLGVMINRVHSNDGYEYYKNYYRDSRTQGN